MGRLTGFEPATTRTTTEGSTTELQPPFHKLNIVYLEIRGMVKLFGLFLMQQNAIFPLATVRTCAKTAQSKRTVRVWRNW